MIIIKRQLESIFNLININRKTELDDVLLNDVLKTIEWCYCIYNQKGIFYY